MEAEIGGNTYRIGKLDARTQLHVWRRLAPIVSAAGGLASIGAIRNVAESTDADQVSTEQLGAYAAMLGPLLDAVAKLPDEDVDYILNVALQAVMRKGEGDTGWHPVMRGGAMMFDDIGPIQMLEIAGRVVIGSPGGGGIGDFFGARRPS